MLPPRSILVPVDFSGESELALDYAVALARRLDAIVHVLHAIPLPNLEVAEIGAALGVQEIDDLVALGKRGLDRLAHQHDYPLQTAIRIGDPRDKILEACAASGCELIVIGSHGRRGLSRAVLGSVAESVLRTASCPVLVVRSPN